MKKTDMIQSMLKQNYHKEPIQPAARSFAPTNIALVKYWGKRNVELNLPMTSSLSISLNEKGTETHISIHKQKKDIIKVNQNIIEDSSSFSQRLIQFLNFFRKPGQAYFDIDIKTNIPIAAGLASSACGFAALIQSLNQLYGWNFNPIELSILARLGSGSASRSLWHGFVEWHVGARDDGMDSHGKLLEVKWPELCIGLLIMQEKEKNLSSREAMQRTVLTSPLYSGWPSKVQQDLELIKSAISQKDFTLLGKTAESNAMTLHALMLSSWPPISYAIPQTITAMHRIWQLRGEGLALYFTQDAGPNLKLLFLQQDKDTVKKYFPEIEIIRPFLNK